MCAQTVRGGDFLDAHRNKRREGERVEVETVKGGGNGGGGVRKARCPVIMTGLCGGAEEKSAQLVS